MTLSLSDARVEDIMRICIDEAELSILGGDPPFACIIVNRSGQILTRAHNTQNSDNDPTAHAEIKAIRQLARILQTTYLDNLIVFTNAESCAMCMFACIKAHVREFYFGAPSEPRVDSWISANEIAMRISPQLVIHNKVLVKECTAQVNRARLSIPFRSNRGQ